MVDEDDMNRLYWPEPGEPKENPNRVYSDQVLSRAQEAFDRAGARFHGAARYPQPRWHNPDHDIVRDLEDHGPESLPLTRREVEESVAAADRRPGISIDDPRVRLGPPDSDAPVRYHLVPDCGNEHDLEPYPQMCPWCGMRRISTRNEELREENRELTEAANRLLQVWSDFDTSSAPIPRHFRIRMENAAQRLRAARP